MEAEIEAERVAREEADRRAELRIQLEEEEAAKLAE